jgi:fructose-bisphosphate aldolase class II
MVAAYWKGVKPASTEQERHAGIVKVNIGTALNVAYTGALRGALTDKADPRWALAAAVADIVAHLVDVVG